jgi:ATP-binding protein involved in chromosome partitioning
MADVDPLPLLEPAATRVRDPVSGRSVWLAGLVQDARVEDGALRFNLVFQAAHDPAARDAIVGALAANLRELGWSGPIRARPVERPVRPLRLVQPPADPVPGMSGPGIAPHGGPVEKRPLDGVRHVVAVASGKGGVGKSTVATNLAVGLRKLGYRTGLLDADIHGPSLPLMMNVTAKPVITDDQRVVPPLAYGVKCLSMGLVVDPGEAMIWRGPMVMDLVRKLLQQTAWGPLDVLVVDLPPGTGDAQLTLVQAIDLAGAVIVTTPQEVALADAVRGLRMFQKLGVPLLGVVENMAYYLLPDGTRDPVFGQDGGKRVAASHGTELLGELPLRTAIRRAGDTGLPSVLGADEVAAELLAVARRVAAKLGLEPT